MNTFKIYDSILSNCQFNTDSKPDWKKICGIINCLPIENCEIIFALILHHYILEIQTKSAKPSVDFIMNQLQDLNGNRGLGLCQPYGVRKFVSGKGVIFTVNNLPEQLQYIIASYVLSVVDQSN